jgi:transposase
VSRFVGVDLHKRMFVVSFYDALAKKHKVKSYKLTEVELFKKELRKEDVLGVESICNTRYFVEQIVDFVKEVKIINPSQFAVISKSVKKTDKNDARTIAEFLSKGMVPEARLKSKIAAQINSLASTRDKFVKLRTVLKNKIHNLLNAYGIDTSREEFSSKGSLSSVLEYKVDAIVKVELKAIVREIENLNANIEDLDKELEEWGKKLDGFESITSIKGIGKKSGAILLSVIGDINDFESEKKLAAYFGIVPRVHQSGDKEWQGHITKRGSKLGRTTLVQCTLVAIKYSSYLRAFYDRIKVKKGSGKAIIATAKKLLGIIYDTLKNKWVFEDFPNYKKKGFEKKIVKEKKSKNVVVV